MTANELTQWAIVMLLNSMMFSLILGIISLNYHRLKYQVDNADFDDYFQQLKFPLNIYRWRNAYIYDERINRSDNRDALNFGRKAIGAFCFVIILMNFIRFNRSLLTQQIILLLLAGVQSAMLFWAVRFGHHLNKQLKRDSI